MACTVGQTPLAPSFEAGPSSCPSVTTTSSSFMFPSAHHASTVHSSFHSPATPTPFRTPAPSVPVPITPFYTPEVISSTVATSSPGTMSQQLPGCAPPRHSNGGTSSPAPPPSLQDFVTKAPQKNVYAEVKWNKFKNIMAQKINQHGKQVVLKQRAADEVDLEDLRIEKLRHLCKLKGLKQKPTDKKAMLYSKLTKYIDECDMENNTAFDEDNAKLDEAIERAKLGVEQAKRELAVQTEIEREIETYDKELERQTLEMRKEEELAAQMEAQMVELVKKRRIAATQSRRPKKFAGRATGAATPRRSAFD